ncbi:MAG: hypothetical protein CMP45_04615 [Rickettsiales bacterium]|nr:hypothetical protein [Verrucomicrobiaceae bacterium]MBV63770.1 hypothetical protein [Rickettsiales bacterium]|tara:strand:+ start:1836 stop:2552 length:717 start_codon:yes stop_codon:yes gene_type:complete
MKTPLFIFLLASSIAANGAITILEDNWDDIGAGAANGLGTGNNAAKTTPIADPTGSGRGNVGAVDIGKLKADGSGPLGTSPWGELRAPWPGSIDLPASAVAGTDSITISADLYIPADTTFDTDAAGNGAADRFNMIVRWNGINQGAGNKKWNWDSLAADTWHSLEFTTLIKENDNDGNATTSIIPIFSFYDRSNNAAPGTAAYIDNVKISVSTSAIPEPSVGVLAILGSLVFLRRRRR